MIFQAHKGVSTENPENTMPAFTAAIAQGYQIIELDVSVTSDLQFVLLHDTVINRTARNESGERISEIVNISDITYQEALKYDFGIWFSKKFKGTKIPLLEDVLKLAEQNSVKLKIDNKYQAFTSVQRTAFLDCIKPYEAVACLTCSCVEELKWVSQIFPKMNFHYDGPVNLEILQKIHEFVPKERLTVWLPHKNPDTSWVKVAFADENLANMIKPFANLGVWILSKYEQLKDAVKLGADVIETNGQLKPDPGAGAIVDMHTHSENSHDSVCKIEDMYHEQTKKGTGIFAVTDHFDTASVNEYDIFTPIKVTGDTVKKLNQKYGSSILSGVEISEGFWYPEAYEKIRYLAEYDVIIGAVHLVKYQEWTMAYSKIDFSLFSKDEIYHYMDAYFDDILTMLETIDFDILAHLTCPVRYLIGKYKIHMDMSCFDQKIERILSQIIQKGIALEVNTASFELLKGTMPTADILKKYYDMGGYLITLGSDAHIRENASFHFSDAITILKEIGFKTVFYYKERKPYVITI